MGKQFGGATAFPPARGVWRDDERKGELIYDETVIVFSYVDPSSFTDEAGEELMKFIRRLGSEGHQGEVGAFVDGTYYGFQDFEEQSTQSTVGSTSGGTHG